MSDEQMSFAIGFGAIGAIFVVCVLAVIFFRNRG